MRYTFMVFLALALNSCQLDFEDNERLLFKGTVSDTSENPIPGLPIEIFAQGIRGSSSSYELIGSGTSTANGTFSIVALSPKELYSIDLRINHNARRGFNSAYVSPTIEFSDIYERSDYTYFLANAIIENSKSTE